MKPMTKNTNRTGKPAKKTRGYRLKPATHLLIGKIQELMQSDQDEAIACACSMFYSDLQKNKAANSASKFTKVMKITINNKYKG